MKTVLCVYKPTGATPLDMVYRVKEKYPEFVATKIGYAGRLDPVAEGLLLLLVGEENTKKLEYERLTKTYTVDILFGFSTDTQDILGLVTDHKNIQNTKKLITNAMFTVQDLPGMHEQIAPDYSAKRYNGKPMYYWARHGKTPITKRPKKTIQILKSTVRSTSQISTNNIQTSIITRINLVHGDFRQNDILDTWNSILSTSTASYPIMTIEVVCTSGTYMRSLVKSIGDALKTPALAWNIRRDAIGDYTKADTIL